MKLNDYAMQEILVDTNEQRKAAIDNLRVSCLKELGSIIANLPENFICNIYRDRIDFGIRLDGTDIDIALSSSIEVYCKSTYRETNINLGSCGSFDPSNIYSFSRIIYSAEMLKNWSEVSDIVNKYCTLYNILYDRILQTNK